MYKRFERLQLLAVSSPWFLWYVWVYEEEVLKTEGRDITMF